MVRPRVIPCLLLAAAGLVKTVRFAKPSYVGDPINAVRIFNEKEVDELVLLDIEASRRNRGPDFDRIQDIVNEAFMPIAYGGGVTTLAQAQQLVRLGVEKVVVNKCALRGYDLLRDMADHLGSQAVVLSVDVKRDWMGRYHVYDATTGANASPDLIEHIQAAVAHGAGEVFVNDVTRDGIGKGYDLELLRKVATSIRVPVIACGGAGTLTHLREAIDAGVSAVAAGSMFVYLGKHRAVMINYPQPSVLRETLRNV
jgi:imidazole glycerol-phosphate synthase subunit HisF